MVGLNFRSLMILVVFIFMFFFFCGDSDIFFFVEV